MARVTKRGTAPHGRRSGLKQVAACHAKRAFQQHVTRIFRPKFSRALTVIGLVETGIGPCFIDPHHACVPPHTDLFSSLNFKDNPALSAAIAT